MWSFVFYTGVLGSDALAGSIWPCEPPYDCCVCPVGAVHQAGLEMLVPAIDSVSGTVAEPSIMDSWYWSGENSERGSCVSVQYLLPGHSTGSSDYLPNLENRWTMHLVPVKGKASEPCAGIDLKLRMYVQSGPLEYALASTLLSYSVFLGFFPPCQPLRPLAAADEVSIPVLIVTNLHERRQTPLRPTLPQSVLRPPPSFVPTRSLMPRAIHLFDPKKTEQMNELPTKRMK